MAYIWEDSSLLSSYQDWKYAKKTSKIISFLFHIILWQLKKIDTFSVGLEGSSDKYALYENWKILNKNYLLN